MPRPNGSKNKSSRKITVANNDFDALIAEKTSAKERLLPWKKTSPVLRLI